MIPDATNPQHSVLQVDTLANVVAGVKAFPSYDELATGQVLGEVQERWITLDARYGANAVWIYDQGKAVLLQHGRSMRVCSSAVQVYPADQDRTSRVWLWCGDAPAFVPDRFLYKTISGTIGQGSWNNGAIHLAVDARVKTYVECRATGTPTLTWESVLDPGDGSAPKNIAGGSSVLVAGLQRIAVSVTDGVQFLALSCSGALPVRIIQGVTP